MAAKKRKEIAQEVKQLGAEGQDVVQQVTNLEKLAELAISTFEDQSEGVTAEAIQSTSEANIRFQNTVEKKVDQKTQKGEEIYDELSVKQESFEQAIVADKTDISKLNTLREQGNSEKINSSEVDKAREFKQEEIEFLQKESQIVQEHQKDLKSKILNSKHRRQAAQNSYRVTSSLHSPEQDVARAIEYLVDAGEVESLENAPQVPKEPQDPEIWTLPPNWQGPSPSRGKWLGARGNSCFELTDEEAKFRNLPKGTKIPFVEGTPDFGAFVKSRPSGKPGQFDVPGLIGYHKDDQPKIIEFLARDAHTTCAEIKRWLRKNKLRAHHFVGCTIQLVPANIHSLAHTGSAAALRREAETKMLSLTIFLSVLKAYTNVHKEYSLGE